MRAIRESEAEQHVAAEIIAGADELPVLVYQLEVNPDTLCRVDRVDGLCKKSPPGTR